MTIKLFFFDMEGTLFEQVRSDHIGSGAVDNSFWGKIVVFLGKEAIKEDQERWQKWENGTYRNHMEWCSAAIDSYQRMGLRYEQFHNLLKNSQYSIGAPELVRELHKRGIVTAIISGGFMEQAARAQKELGIHHALAATQLHWNDEGTIAGWNVLPSDNNGKVNFVELLRQEYGFTKEECAFVGDGKNDLHIAKHVGLSFAYNAHAELQKVATHTITDFREMLQYLE